MAGLAYGIQEEYYNLIGTTTAYEEGRRKTVTSVPVTLTADFTGNAATSNVGGNSELAIYVEYTPGQNSGVFELLVETSADRIDDTPVYYQDVTSAISTGTVVLSPALYQFTGATGGTTYRFRILVPVADNTIKVSVRDTATVKGTATVRLLRSGRL